MGYDGVRAHLEQGRKVILEYSRCIFPYSTARLLDLREFSVENRGESRLSKPRSAEASQRQAILVQTNGNVALKGQ
jgi:hypothetical protein